MFEFVEKVYFVGLTFLSNFTNAISLSCISMKNQECKVILVLVLKQVNVAVVVIILMIHMQKYVFLML